MGNDFFRLAVDISYMAWLADEELQVQRNVVIARDYYDGQHATELTERQRKFLGFQDDGRFALNLCRTVVNAVAERLIVAGFDSADEALAEWAWGLWQAGRMDAVQMDVHRGAVRDGEYFIIVDWDVEHDRPRFLPHPRYADPQAGGDGFGCRAVYPDGDPTQPMQYATKRWSETITNGRGRPTVRQRMTVYYPDRVEKYYLATSGSEAGWLPLEEEGEPWPLPWRDAAGRPLGIPVIHFRNPGSRSELWDAIPIQDAINKTVLDLLASADAAGVPIFKAIGCWPTTDGKPPADDGSNLLKVFPGCWLGSPSQDAQIDTIPPADLRPMLDLLDSLILKLAQVTDTPTSRFQLTRQVAAEGTLKQQEAPLLAKVRARQVVFGNAWEDALYMARRLANAHGAGVPEDATLETMWVPAAIRDEREHLESLALKREKLGVPLEQIWREAGYSQEQIDEMKQMEESLARQAQWQATTQSLQALSGGG